MTSLDQGTAALATTLDLDWIVSGSNNTIDFRYRCRHGY